MITNQTISLDKIKRLDKCGEKNVDHQRSTSELMAVQNQVKDDVQR